MSASILDRLIRDALFRELKQRMMAAMETAFDEAWRAAMESLVSPQGAPPAAVTAPAERAAAAAILQSAIVYLTD